MSAEYAQPTREQIVPDRMLYTVRYTLTLHSPPQTTGTKSHRDLSILPRLIYFRIYLSIIQSIDRSTSRQEELVRPLHPLHDPQLLAYRYQPPLSHQLGQVLLQVDEVSSREPTRSRPNQPQELVDQHHELPQIEFVQHPHSHSPLATPSRHDHLSVRRWVVDGGRRTKKTRHDWGLLSSSSVDEAEIHVPNTMNKQGHA